MVTIDVTPNWVNALGGAASALEGVNVAMEQQRQSKLQEEHLALQRKHQALQEEMAQQAMQFRQSAFEEASAEREGRRAALDQYAGISGAQFAPKPPGPETAQDWLHQGRDLPPSSVDDDEGEQLEQFLADQRKNAIAAGLDFGPAARSYYLQNVLPLLNGDEQEERTRYAQRRIHQDWEKLKQSQLLRPEEMQLVDTEMQMLDAGMSDPAASGDALATLQRAAAKRFKEAANYQFGIQFAKEQQTAFAAGGGNPAKMHAVLAKWMAGRDHSDNALDSLRESLLSERYGVKLDKVKLGTVEVPKTMTVADPGFRAIAETQADREVVRMLGSDPLVKRMIAQIPEGGEAAFLKNSYLPMRERLRKSLIRGYGAQLGADYATMRQLGYGDDEYVRQEASKALEDAFKEAGIDPSVLDTMLEEAQAPTPAPRTKGTTRAPVVPSADVIDETTFFHSEDR